MFAECLAVALACGDQHRLTGSGSALEVFCSAIQIHVLYFFNRYADSKMQRERETVCKWLSGCIMKRYHLQTTASQTFGFSYKKFNSYIESQSVQKQIFEETSAISNDENGCRHLCLFIRIFINNFFQTF